MPPPWKHIQIEARLRGGWPLVRASTSYIVSQIDLSKTVHFCPNLSVFYLYSSGTITLRSAEP